MRPYKFKFQWRRPTIVRVTAADKSVLFCFNTYPGCWIGVAFYWRGEGLSLLWGRPGKVVYL